MLLVCRVSSRIFLESHEFRLRKERVDLHEVISNVVGLFREGAERKRIGLSSRVADDIPSFQGDSRALEQVVSNLVDNAVKYCPPGSALLVTVVAKEKCFELSVKDTGPGIEPKHIPRLFERFYRVDAGRSREVGGTGLGLSIVKHLVEAMGGTVGVESTLGEGATFIVSIPRVPLDCAHV
jgi:two-component system phosphate regulon sensor histidine kinase PhoR